MCIRDSDYLGVQCGLLDQVGSLLSKPGHVMQVDFRDETIRYVPAQFSNLRWVVLHTGVRRELADSLFPTRVRECAEGLRAVQAHDPRVMSMRDVRLEHLTERRVWTPRLRHLVLENERVQKAAEYFASADVRSLGKLVTQTHMSLRDDYAVSCPELDALVEIAVGDPRCWGARMVGGGFGGCTLNLVQADEPEAFAVSYTHLTLPTILRV